MATSKARLASQFIETKSYKYDPAGNFKLSSGLLSKYYVDCKSLMASPKGRALVAELAYETVKHLPFEHVGGLETGAIAISTTVSDYAFRENSEQAWGTFFVRKQPKEHGLRNLIEGPVNAGDRVLIVDDVLTSGGSIIKAVNAVREADLKVEYALVIVDREEQNGRAYLESNGLTLHSLLTISDLREAAKFLASTK